MDAPSDAVILDPEEVQVAEVIGPERRIVRLGGRVAGDASLRVKRARGGQDDEVDAIRIARSRWIDDPYRPIGEGHCRNLSEDLSGRPEDCRPPLFG